MFWVLLGVGLVVLGVFWVALGVCLVLPRCGQVGAVASLYPESPHGPVKKKPAIAGGWVGVVVAVLLEGPAN